MRNLEKIGYPHYAVTREGQVYSLHTNKFLSKNKMLGCYMGVTICEEMVRVEELVHRLVAKAYIPNPNNLPCVNHKDGDKLNNSVSNLEWCSYLENTQHAMDTGLRRTSVINEYRSLSNEVASKICDMLEQGSRNKDICELLNVDCETVSGIKSGRYYKDISEDFDFRKVSSSNRISEQKVIKICELLIEGFTINKIRLEVQVNFSVVKSIKERKTYTYISKSYEW